MKSNKRAIEHREPRAHHDDPKDTGRRALLGRLLAAVSAAVVALATGVGVAGRRAPREHELHEADFHGPHDLAG